MDLKLIVVAGTLLAGCSEPSPYEISSSGSGTGQAAWILNKRTGAVRACLLDLQRQSSRLPYLTDEKGIACTGWANPKTQREQAQEIRELIRETEREKHQGSP